MFYIGSPYQCKFLLVWNRKYNSFVIILENIRKTGSDVKIKWYFDEDDEDMEMAGEEYDNLIEVPFELISVEVDDEDF